MFGEESNFVLKDDKTLVGMNPPTPENCISAQLPEDAIDRSGNSRMEADRQGALASECRLSEARTSNGRKARRNRLWGVQEPFRENVSFGTVRSFCSLPHRPWA